MTYTAMQMQSLLIGLSRQLAALYGRELKNAGLEISALAQGSSDETIAAVLNGAYARASTQAIELVRLFGQVPELADDPAWQALEARYMGDFEDVVERIHDNGRLHVEKLSDILRLIGQATSVDLPGSAGQISDILGLEGGIAEDLLTAGKMIIAVRDGDYSTMATILTMGTVGKMIDATLARFPYIGPVLSASGLVGLLEDALEESVSEGMQRIFGDSEARYMVERCYQLYGQGFQEFSGTEFAALMGTSGNDQVFGLVGKSNIIGGGSGHDDLAGDALADILGGGSGRDRLDGHGGNDVLEGGDDNDELWGGTGNDRLEGGDGVDRYVFKDEDFADGVTRDIILDSDGQGIIEFNGAAFGTDLGSGAVYRYGAQGFYWRTADEKFNLLIGELNPDGTRSLTIVHRATNSRIVVEKWSDGLLGITLPTYNQPGTPENPMPQTNGDDLVGRDGVVGSVPSGNDYIHGLEGNDGIDGGYGDDHIDGGGGDDLLLGGPGDNEIIGGSGNDVIMSGSYVMSWHTAQELGTSLDNMYSPINHLAQHSRGNGWAAYYSDDLPFDADEVTRRLLGLYVGAWGFGGEEVWRMLDPNVFRNGRDIIDAGSGADTVLSGEGDDVIDGGSGDDLLIGGHDADLINGGDDNDIIFGDVVTAGNSSLRHELFPVSSNANIAGDDVLDGGGGDDLIYGQGGSDIVTGGAGNDSLWGDRINWTLDHPLYSPGPAGDDQLDGGEGNDSLIGNEGNDTLLGGSGNDELFGDDWFTPEATHGNDILDGGIGNDILHGNGGNDRLEGGDGRDFLFGDSGNDQLSGGTGNDELQGGSGDDRLAGGEGDDRLFGDEGNDTLSGDNGDDQLQGGEGNDLLNGGEGNDILAGWTGDDVLNGGRGDDQLDGGEGNDRLSGGEGWDTLMGGSGNDVLDGGTSGDYLQGGEGQDILYGGEGNDGLYGEDGADVLHGGSGSDYIEGGDGHDVLHGDADGDQLVGGYGNDTLDGGTGNDLLQGGAGRDTYLFSEDSGHDVIEDGDADSFILLAANIDFDQTYVQRINDDVIIRMFGNADWSLTLRGYMQSPQGAGADITFHDGRVLTQQWIRDAVIQPTSGDDYLTGYETPDTLSGGQGNDSISGMEGDDILDGGEGNDWLSGGTGDDILQGGAGDDVLFGEEGNNQLYGGDGNDTLDSRLGNALMDGGAGEDNLSGHDGDDTYLFQRGNQIDWVRYGTTGGTDTLRLGPDIALDDLEFVLSTNMFTGLSLSIRIKGTDDVFNVYTALDVTEAFPTSVGEIDRVEFADGTVMTAADFYAHVVAHAVQTGEPDQARVGSAAADVLTGGDGGEFIYGMGGDDLITAGAGNDNVRAGLGDDVVHGGAGDDGLRGGAGADQLYGGLGNDTLIGGYGDDSFYYNAGDGQDSIMDAWANGTPYDDLDGGGFDRLYLGAGLDSAGVTVTRNGDSGLMLHFAGRPDDRVTLDNQLWGENEISANAIEEIVFADGTVWTTQDLLARVDTPPTVNRVLAPVVALVGKAFSYTFPADLFSDNGPLTWEVSNFPEWMQYDPQTRTLTGQTPNDLTGYYGVSIVATDSVGQQGFTSMQIMPASPILGTASSEDLFGTAYSDAIYGYAGNDRIDGGAGADFMYGGKGNDGYSVDHASDQVIELAGEGVDSVFSTVTYTLGENVENLTLNGSGTINATGNGDDNTLRGNAAANVLMGMAGDDVLDGAAGADRLFGGDGNDELTGGTGLDYLEGGAGDDVYNMTSEADVIVELAGGGIDLVRSSANSFTLGDHLENLEVTGFGYGIGNALNNTLTGSASSNSLEGMDGNDVLDGRAGLDYLLGGLGSDLYLMGYGYGSDAISETASEAGDHDVARFVNVAHNRLWLSRDEGSDDLSIDILGTDDSLRITNWFLGEQYRVETFEATGVQLASSDVDALLSAMQQLGKTDRSVLTSVQLSALRPAFEAAWRADAPAGAQRSASMAYAGDSNQELLSLVSAMSTSISNGSASMHVGQDLNPQALTHSSFAAAAASHSLREDRPMLYLL